MQEESFQSLSSAGFHKICMTVWGKENDDPVPVVCAHGLSRNGRDFDKLASALAKTRTVYCPDFPGRGRSEDLRDPMRYEITQYMTDMTMLIARTGATQVDWVGTSMGGLVGLLLAAQPGVLIRRLVLNDVGPVVTKKSVEDIRDKLLKTKTFDTIADAEKTLRRSFAGFGKLSNEDWAHMAQHGVRKTPEGKYILAYDPNIVEPMKGPPADVDLWAFYDAITAPTLVLRGAESDLLSSEVAEEMTRRGPCAWVETIPETGHAPSLMTQEQIEIVAKFLGPKQDAPGLMQAIHKIQQNLT